MENMVIHPTALIDPKSEIGDKVSIGPFTIVEANVRIGNGTTIASNVLLAAGTRIGADCRIFNGAVLGTIPQDLKFGGEESELSVGDRTIIREFCTLNRGTRHGHLNTKVGSDCMLMAYAHVAHDCSLGNGVIMANSVNLAGHVDIGDGASIGGMSAVHQFVKIGMHAFIGGMARISQDIPPFIRAAKEPLRYFGPNSIGLRRKGFTNSQIQSIKSAYRLLYRSGYNVKQGVQAIKDQLDMTPEVEEILRFIEHSKRGLIGIGVKGDSATFD